jgi:competence protein ComEA
MKTVWTVAISIAASLLAAGILLLLSRPMRGQPVTLQPAPTETDIPLLLVHIAGAVKAPGVYELPPGSRLRDALQAAGGVKKGADTQHLNQAARLEDGQYLFVPYLEIDLIIPSAVPQEIPVLPGRSSEINIDGPVNINTATQEALETLPGVGPVIAQRIIEYRQANGPFQTIEDIQKVKGIGTKTFEKMQGLITVGGP